MLRYYFANTERSAITDKSVARNIRVSFTNDTQLPIDTLILIFYSDAFVIDVETGIIRKERGKTNYSYAMTDMMLSSSINLLA